MINNIGNTYERENLEKYILDHGNYDPKTSKKISNILYPNLAMK